MSIRTGTGIIPVLIILAIAVGTPCAVVAYLFQTAGVW